MPISRMEFEKGELDPSFAIEDFLRSNSDNAYTADEIIVKLASNRMALKAEEVKAILVELENEGKVRGKMVRSTVYYTYLKPFGR